MSGVMLCNSISRYRAIEAATGDASKTNDKVMLDRAGLFVQVSHEVSEV